MAGAAAALPAAAYIDTDVDAFAETWVTATDQDIAIESTSDGTSVAGDQVSVTATATAIGCGGDDNSFCSVGPSEDLQDGGAAARAPTDYGSNRVYVRSNHYDLGGVVSHVDAASASSAWMDEWTLGGNVTGLPDFTVTLRADGSWSDRGAFALQVLLVNTQLGTTLGDDGLPTGTVARGVMTNACEGGYDGGLSLAGCNALPLPPGFPAILPGNDFVDVNPDADESGIFDHLLQLSAAWSTGRTYQVIVRLTAATGARAGSLLDAESTARVTQVLIPEGGTLTSSAGALGSYNVTSVPAPAVGWMVGAAVAGLGWRSRRRPRPARP
jgi:hypothetical protein